MHGPNPSMFNRLRRGAQLAQLLSVPRRLLLIRSHTGYLSGNALGLALAAQASRDFAPVFIGNTRQ